MNERGKKVPETSVITTKLEPRLEREVDAIFRKLGITATEAIALFYKMVKRENGLPFEIEISNDNKGNKSSGEEETGSWLGCLEDCTEIHGDIVSPVMDENQWEVLAG